jgi:FtsZ-binding cell division protein ZapB
VQQLGTWENAAMAFSPNSRHHSRIIREMSRDLNKTNHSCASSTGSHHGTVSDDSTSSDFFDPENEAIMSTRQMDLNYSQKLPELRGTAKKYGRWNGGRQPDFAINTSAIGRAFPDFSQGGSSDDSMSIEVGRGAKTRQRTSSQQPRSQYSNNIDSPIVTIGDFQILSTPPMKPQSKPSQPQDTPRSSTRKESNSKRTSAQKENIPPANNATSTKKIPGYISGATRTSSGEQRRTLAELHAQVADDSDGSFIGDERPATVTIAPKSSRFANFQPRNSPLANVSGQSKQKVTDALIDALADRRSLSQKQTPSKPPSNGTTTSNTINPTNQSFLLPNMPDISELVSGTFKDGTPVFTRSGKVQSRFSSAGGDWKAHDGLDGIPVPQEEKDIFLSLQLLQEKVAALEMEKADTQIILEDLQKENYQLQAEREEYQRRRRSDSALGMADSGSDGEYARDNQKLVAEKTSTF